LSVITNAVIETNLGSGTGFVTDLQPTVALLDDGTYFVASMMYSSGTPQIIRMWHLASDLSVLGTADITFALHQSPIPRAIAIAGNKVLLISQAQDRYYSSGWFNTRTYQSWIVDCNSLAPFPAAPTVLFTTTTTTYAYDYNGSFNYVYDRTADRVVITCRDGSYKPVLQVFTASTGVMLCEIPTGIVMTQGVVGLFMDPIDSTKFVMTTATVTTSTPNSPGLWNFTVAADGLSGSYDGQTTLPGAPDPPYGYQWATAVGSPYIFGGIIDNGKYYSFTGDYVGDLITSGSVVANPSIPVSSPDGKILYQYVEVTDGAVYSGEFWCVVDQSATPPVLESLALPYFGIPADPGAVSSGYYPCVVANPTNGEVVAVTSIVGADVDYTTSVIAWKIQGPGNKPNLSGQLLDNRVRFTGV
jgi:hypothetical protein